MPGPVDTLQRNLGVRVTGEWDATTYGALLAYQQSGRGAYPMSSSGHADPATLANLGYYEPLEAFPGGMREYLAGTGEKPGTFMRDVGTAIDQVPRWAWGAAAVLFGGFAYLAYRGDKKRKAA